MPGRLKVRVVAGRHLPIMDRASELTDAFVEVKFATVTYKTDVFTKSLNPIWDSEWFKFEVDDALLQDEPLQIRVLDYDTYSSHDPIGKVYIDIDPLLDPNSSHYLCGWFPIYDTMHGIRGEVLIIVRLELFADVNQFKQSSCGFKFICGTNIPENYVITKLHGFVHELIINEDPEYKWIDKLRTPRSTNEARQRLFSKMSGELQRHIGSKVEHLGGNAIIGYFPSFDIEGESGVVARGIGTAVTIVVNPCLLKKTQLSQNVEFFQRSLSSSYCYTSTIKPNKASDMHQDEKRNEFSSQQNNFHIYHDDHNLLQDYPFYTLTSFPHKFIERLSIVVTSRSVKILEKIHNQDELETRNMWWAELRQEIKSHCEALACNAVLGYAEHTAICDEVIILSAQGTAAVVNHSYFNPATNIEDSSDFVYPSFETSNENTTSFQSENEQKSDMLRLFRAPVKLAEQICPVTFQPSPLDLKTLVPVIYISTIDPPHNVKNVGQGTLIQARFCRSKKKCQSETNAVLVSEILPFLEYELHKQLHNKLKLYGMNAIFGLETKITLGENLIVGVATGTMAYLHVLPNPNSNIIEGMPNPNIVKDEGFSASILVKQAIFNKKSKEVFQLDSLDFGSVANSLEEMSSPLNSIENISLNSENRTTLAIGIEDLEEEEDLQLLMEDQFPPPQCNITNLDECPGVSLENMSIIQTFSYVWRVKYDDEADDRKLNQGLRNSFNNALSSVWFHLRRTSKICQLTSIRFNLSLPDDDDLQIWINGTCLAPNETKKQTPSISTSSKIPYTRSQSLSGDLLKTKNDKNDKLDMDEGTEKSLILTASEGTSKTKMFGSLDESLHADHSKTSPRDISLPVKDNRASSSLVNHPLSPMFHKIKRASTMGGRTRHDSGSKLRSRYYSDSSAYSAQHLELLGAQDVGIIQTVPMSYVPGKVILKHIGLLNMFIIRETTAVRGSEEEILMAEPANGTGCSWFVSRSLAETQAIIRSHVVAVGGNCLTSYRLCSCVLDERTTKNEAQCLLHVTGDIVVTSP